MQDERKRILFVKVVYEEDGGNTNYQSFNISQLSYAIFTLPMDLKFPIKRSEVFQSPCCVTQWKSRIYKPGVTPQPPKSKSLKYVVQRFVAHWRENLLPYTFLVCGGSNLASELHVLKTCHNKMPFSLDELVRKSQSDKMWISLKDNISKNIVCVSYESNAKTNAWDQIHLYICDYLQQKVRQNKSSKEKLLNNPKPVIPFFESKEALHAECYNRIQDLLCTEKAEFMRFCHLNPNFGPTLFTLLLTFESFYGSSSGD